MKRGMTLPVTLILSSLLLSQCARYPAIPELKGSAPLKVENTLEDKQMESRMRDVLLSLKKAEPKDYIIGIKDVLQVDVWLQPDLSRAVEVSQDGTINLPLIGNIIAKGKTTSLLEQHITKELEGRYLVHPQVTVKVLEYSSKYVSVLGEVGGIRGGKGVGQYPLRGRTTLLEVLAEAAPLENAGSECIVIRPKNKASSDPTLPSEAKEGEVIHVDIEALMKGDLLQNIELQDGDTIYVPKARPYFVFGQVRQPGQYKYEKGITVIKAITTAGGLTEKAASIKRVRILREEEGVKRRISVNPTDFIKPDDTIIVPESFF